MRVLVFLHSYWISDNVAPCNNYKCPSHLIERQINKDWSFLFLGEQHRHSSGSSGRRPQVPSKRAETGMNRITSGVSSPGSSRMGSHGSNSLGSHDSNSLGSSGRGENLARVLARAGTNMTLACPGLTPTSYVYLVEWKCIGCKCTG